MRSLIVSILGVVIGISGCLSTGGKEQKEKDTVPVYAHMATSEIKRNPDPRLLDFRKKPKWSYTNGLVCSAMIKAWEVTGDDQFLNYAKYYADSMITDDGVIKTYKRRDFNIDNINPGKFVLELLKIDPRDEYKKAVDTLRWQMADHPRTSEGGFWHKKRYPHQMWLDGLYMGSPFLAQYAMMYDEPELFDDVANQIILMDKYAWNTEKEFYYHGWDESREQRWSNPQTGLSPHPWGRAMGWYAMALVDVLEFFPKDHEKRQEILNVVSKLAESIKKYQDPESGLWWQVLDQGGREGNYLESSCSSMFVYFLLKSIENGYLSEDYMPMTKKAYESIISRFVKKNADGTISLTDVCAVAGLGGKPYRDGSYDYYISEPKRDNDPKGIGPFIMAAILYEKLTQSN